MGIIDRIFRRNNNNTVVAKSKKVVTTSNFVHEKTVIERRKVIVKNVYSVNPPYAYIMIFTDKKGILRYHVLEPFLTANEKTVLNDLKELILEEVRIPVGVLRNYEEAVKSLSKSINSLVRSYRINLTKQSLDKIKYYLIRDLIGYGKIDPIYRDPYVEDIVCDGYNIPVYVFHRDFEWMPTNVIFKDPDELESFIRRLAFRAGQSITYARPIVEGPLPPEGFRVHLTLKEVSRRGSTFTIRKYSVEPYTIVDLLKFNTLSVDMAAYLWLLLDNVMSLMVLGQMASGKTTLLNAIAMMIRPEAKIVTIEETPEIRLAHENWVPMTVRPSFEPGVQDITLFELLKSALRQRPEYIIVGEIRGREAYTFFQALAVGHGGLTTIHGESVQAVISRLENEPMNIPRILIPLIKTFIHMGRVRVRGEEELKRRVLRIVETVGINPSTKEIMLSEVYTWDPLTDSWKFSGRIFAFEHIAANRGIPLSEVYKDFERRKTVLEWMKITNKTTFSEVAEVLRSYYRDPEEVYREAESVVKRRVL